MSCVCLAYVREQCKPKNTTSFSAKCLNSMSSMLLPVTSFAPEYTSSLKVLFNHQLPQWVAHFTGNMLTLLVSTELNKAPTMALLCTRADFFWKLLMMRNLTCWFKASTNPVQSNPVQFAFTSSPVVTRICCPKCACACRHRGCFSHSWHAGVAWLGCCYAAALAQRRWNVGMDGCGLSRLLLCSSKQPAAVFTWKVGCSDATSCCCCCLLITPTAPPQGACSVQPAGAA